MKVLARAFLILSLVSCSAIHAEASKPSPPVRIRLLHKPSALVAGEKHTFTIEVKNNSDVPLTLSTLSALSWSLFWSNPDGSGQGRFSAGGSKLIIGTDINPETGEITCKYLHYDRSGFITLPPNGSKRFDIVVDVPGECDAASADMTIDFESKYDGSEIGLKAWVGKGKSLNLHLPVRRGSISRVALSFDRTS